MLYSPKSKAILERALGLIVILVGYIYELENELTKLNGEEDDYSPGRREAEEEDENSSRQNKASAP
jgi:hypothetical protein